MLHHVHRHDHIIFLVVVAVSSAIATTITSDITPTAHSHTTIVDYISTSPTRRPTRRVEDCDKHFLSSLTTFCGWVVRACDDPLLVVAGCSTVTVSNSGNHRASDLVAFSGFSEQRHKIKPHGIGVGQVCFQLPAPSLAVVIGNLRGCLGAYSDMCNHNEMRYTECDTYGGCQKRQNVS